MFSPRVSLPFSFTLVHGRVAVVLIGHAGGAAVELLRDRRRPPVAQVAVARRTAGPGRRSRASARGPSPCRWRRSSRASEPLRVEEGRLQDAGREHDLVAAMGRSRRSRSGGGISHSLAVERLADLGELRGCASNASAASALRKKERAVDLERVVVPPAVGVADLVHDVRELVVGSLPRGRRPSSGRASRSRSMAASIPEMISLRRRPCPRAPKVRRTKAWPSASPRAPLGDAHAVLPARLELLGAGEGLAGEGEALVGEGPGEGAGAGHGGEQLASAGRRARSSMGTWADQRVQLLDRTRRGDVEGGQVGWPSALR